MDINIYSKFIPSVSTLIQISSPWNIGDVFSRGANHEFSGKGNNVTEQYPFMVGGQGRAPMGLLEGLHFPCHLQLRGLPRSEAGLCRGGWAWGQSTVFLLSFLIPTCAHHLRICGHQSRSTGILSTRGVPRQSAVLCPGPHLLLKRKSRVSGSQPHVPFSCLLVSRSLVRTPAKPFGPLFSHFQGPILIPESKSPILAILGLLSLSSVVWSEPHSFLHHC